MAYFSNKPAPSTGSDLPMPQSSKEVSNDVKVEHRAKRRKLETSDGD